MVYGNGEELILDDVNELDSIIVVSKKPLHFERIYSYYDVIDEQNIDDPYCMDLFSSKDSLFKKDKIHIDKLRELNGFSENEQTVSYFGDLGMDEDYTLSKKLMNKIVNGIKLSPIVVDEKYKILDGSHRLAAYSELYYYHSYDFDFDGKLKIYKRISN